MKKKTEYWLLQNGFFPLKRVIRRRWYHSFIGTPGMFVIAKCFTEEGIDGAIEEFRNTGWLVWRTKNEKRR